MSIGIVKDGYVIGGLLRLALAVKCGGVLAKELQINQAIVKEHIVSVALLDRKLLVLFHC